MMHNERMGSVAAFEAELQSLLDKYGAELAKPAGVIVGHHSEIDGWYADKVKEMLALPHDTSVLDALLKDATRYDTARAAFTNGGLMLNGEDLADVLFEQGTPEKFDAAIDAAVKSNAAITGAEVSVLKAKLCRRIYETARWNQVFRVGEA